jgi:transposase-like protein
VPFRNGSYPRLILTELGAVAVRVSRAPVQPSGAAAALPLVYPHLLVQRCWAYKMRNILDQCPKSGRPRVKRDLHRIRNAGTLALARSAVRRFDDPAWRNAVRSTNATERHFPEVRRRTRPMGVMTDHTSIEASFMPSSRGRTETKASAPLFLFRHKIPYITPGSSFLDKHRDSTILAHNAER